MCARADHTTECCPPPVPANAASRLLFSPRPLLFFSVANQVSAADCPHCGQTPRALDSLKRAHVSPHIHPESGTCTSGKRRGTDDRQLHLVMLLLVVGLFGLEHIVFFRGSWRQRSSLPVWVGGEEGFKNERGCRVNDKERSFLTPTR